MPQEKHTVTAAEWNVMEFLWSNSPCTGREAVDYLSSSVNWSRSTTLTMLRRMNQKGMIASEERDGVITYTPLLHQEDTTLQETVNFINRVYHGSVSMMLSAFTKKQPLTSKEIAELYAILDEAKEDSNHD